ncbi:MAG: hypothetical protein IJ571_00610, partial [Ruminococcus sp.]|nr:hypothetical protein [Ruminococcus sp.]
MKKTLGTRLLSGATALFMSASLALGSFPAAEIIASAEAENGNQIFALDEAALDANRDNGLYPNNMYAKISFSNADGSDYTTSLPDNTYYLLVHALGKNSGSYTYATGADQNHYKLYEISNDNGSWTSPAFGANINDALMPTIVDHSNPWSTTYRSPDAMSLDGTILKNTAGGELTLERAKSLSGCEETKYIEGISVTNSGELVNNAGNQWGTKNTFDLAAVSGQVVHIDVFDFDNQPATLVNDISANYFALALITDKETGDKLGWAVQQFYPETDTKTTLAFTKFYPYGEDGGDTTGTQFAFDAENQKIDIRVYRTLDETTELETYKDCTDTRKASYDFRNYTFTNETEGNVTNITMTQSSICYEVDFDVTGDVQISDSDDVYVYVRVQHKSTGEDYYFRKLNQTDIDAGKIVIQDGDTENWLTEGGAHKDNARFNGNEDVYFYLVKGLNGNSVNINMANSGTDCGIINDGDIVTNIKVTYNEQPGEKSRRKEGTTVVYSNTVNLEALTASSSSWNYQSVLGDGINFGITADRFEQNMHAETNFAVNMYETGHDLEPDLSGLFGGHIYVAEYVHFQDNMTKEGVNKDTYKDFDFYNKIEHDLAPGTDKVGRISIGDAHCDNGVVLHTDDPLNRLTDQRRAKDATHDGFVALVPETKEDIRNNTVNPALRNMEGVSKELLNNEPTVSPVIIGGKAYIDTTKFADDATIFIDGDDENVLNYLSDSGKFVANIKDGQTIIFNFDESKTVRVDEFVVHVFDENGDEILPPGLTAPDNNSQTTAGGSGKSNNIIEDVKNKWLGQYATRQFVFNLNSAEYVEIDKAAGIFLNPNEKSITNVTGTSSGWLMSSGYVSNTGGEWHFLYDGIPGNTTQIKIDKTDITGDYEIAGAQLEIVDKKTGKTVAKWTSDGENVHSVRLAPGTYILKETGENFEYEGTTYSVTDSTLEFTVTAIENSYDCKVTVNDQTSLKEAADDTLTDAYYLYDAANKVITICDAAANGTPVELAKTDIAGSPEVSGAKIELYQYDVQKEEYVKYREWTSDNGKTATFYLPDASYYFVETAANDADTFKDGDKEYKIVPNKIYFEVSNGTVTLDDEKATENRTAQAVDEENGYIKFEEAKEATTTTKASNAKFTFLDAEVEKITVDIDLDKVAISGNEEIKGAKIEIYKVEGTEKTLVDSWTSGDATKSNTFTLGEGNYVLKEASVDNNLNKYSYKVIESEVEFSIDKEGNLTV